MKNRKVVLGALVVCLAAATAALASLAAAKPAKHAKVFKVAWIYPGPHNDGGWSQAHDAGRLYVEKMLGGKVQTTYKENVFSNASVPQIVAGLVRDGYNMIFGASFGQFELGVNGQLYAKYPKVLFEQATGLQVKSNQAEYFGAGEDSIYLSGMAAGAATKKGTIGYVVPYGIPEVVRHLNAFALGAQATHPGAKVKLVWTNAYCTTARNDDLIAKGLITGDLNGILGSSTLNAVIGRVMFFKFCIPTSWKVIGTLSRTCWTTISETQMPPGSAPDSRHTSQAPAGSDSENHRWPVVLWRKNFLQLY